MTQIKIVYSSHQVPQIIFTYYEPEKKVTEQNWDYMGEVDFFLADSTQESKTR